LTSLNLNYQNNGIGDEGAAKLSLSLSKLMNLTTLDLNFWNNKIGDEGAA
jgi:hypothetical protein